MAQKVQDYEKVFTKYEIARIIGARALQLSMGAPMLIKKPENLFDPVKLAEVELKQGVLPLSIKRPQPQKVVEAQ